MHSADALKIFFNPKSIAVIGASRNKNKIGYIAVKNIVESGYRGKVYPINPFAKKILGLDVCADLASLPVIVDLAIISLPSLLVIENLYLVAQKGIKNVLIYSAGFKELGYEGEILEQQISKIQQKFNLNILGPNCLGFLNNSRYLNTTFADLVSHKGSLNFISQSGAVASSMFDFSKKVGLGFNYFITLGNKTDITEVDILNYFKYEVPENPIGMYIESISNGFLEQVSYLSKRCPVFILKPGKSKAAKKAMQSHTGSLSSEDVVTSNLFNQYGLIRCNGLQELFDLSMAFSWCRNLRGNRVAIVSNAGGPAVISTDLLSENNLKVAKLGKKTISFLRKHLPRESSITNPIDVLGDALVERYTAALTAVLANKDIDSVLVLLTPQLMTQIEDTAKAIHLLSNKYSKPIFCSFIGGVKVEKGESLLYKYKIPVYSHPERALYCLGKLYGWYKHSLSNIQYKNFIRQSNLFPTTNKFLTAQENIKLIDQFSLTVPSSIITLDYKKALNFSKKNFPVVLKISSTTTIHKTESKSVLTNIINEKDLKSKFDYLNSQIKSNKMQEGAIQIQQQILDGIEVFVGIKTDVTFGPILVFGAGGKYIEIFNDKNIINLTADKSQIKRLVKDSVIYRILKGYRKEEYAIESLYSEIEKIIKIYHTYNNIKEIEVNPIIVTSSNAYITDLKVYLY